MNDTKKIVGNKIFKSITYFGDGIWDFTVATELGYNFIGIDFNGNGFLKKIGVENVYRNFIELLDKKLYFNLIYD
jgi:hypothetical protein